MVKRRHFDTICGGFFRIACLLFRTDLPLSLIGFNAASTVMTHLHNWLDWGRSRATRLLQDKHLLLVLLSDHGRAVEVELFRRFEETFRLSQHALMMVERVNGLQGQQVVSAVPLTFT